jgi:hypothetical protein
MGKIRSFTKMTNFRITAAIVVLLFTISIDANAHHSRNNFLLDQTVSINGKVTAFTFRSPHAWITLEARSPSGELIEYTIEGGSVGSLRRFGWTKESLAVGDYVTVVGNPDRKPTNLLLYLNSVAKSDGEILMVTGEPVVAAKNTDQATSPSTDFSGIWTRVATEHYFNVGAFEPPVHWPLTEKGRAQVERFTMRDDPLVNCISPSLPRLAYAPFRHRWTRDGDRLTTEKELSPFGRSIDLGVVDFPSNIDPSRIGTSIGWVDEDGALNLETRGFVQDDWGNYRGLDSSTQKIVREKYVLAEDGLSMDLALTIEDPVYLSEPYTEYWKLVKGPDFDGDLAKQDCDLESAGRHLEFED